MENSHSRCRKMQKTLRQGRKLKKNQFCGRNQRNDPSAVETENKPSL